MTPHKNTRQAVGETGQMLILLRLFGFLLMWGGLDAFFDPIYTVFRSAPVLAQRQCGTRLEARVPSDRGICKVSREVDGGHPSVRQLPHDSVLTEGLTGAH